MGEMMFQHGLGRTHRRLSQILARRHHVKLEGLLLAIALLPVPFAAHAVILQPGDIVFGAGFEFDDTGLVVVRLSEGDGIRILDDVMRGGPFGLFFDSDNNLITHSAYRLEDQGGNLIFDDVGILRVDRITGTPSNLGGATASSGVAWRSCEEGPAAGELAPNAGDL